MQGSVSVMSQALPCPPFIVEHSPEQCIPLAEDTISSALIQPHLLNASRRPSLVISTATGSSHGDVHTGKSWAENVEDPWIPLILTLDGGGIRGYASLLIIERLMNEVAVWENHFEQLEQPDKSKRKVFDATDLLPAHYFDFMYGTSTGGLIATMLGRLRMNIPDCLAYYKVVGNSLFAHRRNVLPLGTKYKHKPLEKAVKEIVKKHCPVHIDQSCSGEDWLPWHLDKQGEEPVYLEPYTEDSVERICQSICLTATHGTAVNEAYLLRSYNHQYGEKAPYHITLYNIGAEKLRIWEATRATSAAPFFFKALIADVLDETRTTMIRASFKDGGIRQNNPSVAAYTEFLSLYGDERRPALLLSIGTGVPSKENDGFGETWPGPFGHIPAVKKVAETFAVFKNMLVKYTQGEQSHQSMVLEAKGQHTWYKRLNVDKGLQNMKLDNWVSSEEVESTTDGMYPLFFCYRFVIQSGECAISRHLPSNTLALN
ncbi:FabD/lysophospholipase-like protein [Venturia nashicola]|nr:FabD/lysophospholipase-like protein [Venturia nashicola]